MADDRPHQVESRVRTEHDLRTQLRIALERNAMLERALSVAAEYAHGRREQADLRRLKAILSTAGFSDPNAGKDEHEA
jgi:hypothetical protein